jgi:pimeloyl-ACP methyl ester carboxylesterase
MVAADRLHHEIRGTSGPPVLLLHGLGSSSTDWEWQVPAFAAHHRVIVVDMPGHGRSPRRGPATAGTMAAAVEMVLAALDAPPVHVVGLSLGGCVGLTLALRAPARVRSLTLVNAFARLRPVDPRWMLRLLVRLALLAGAPMSVVAAHVARGLFPRADQAALYRQAVERLRRTSRRSYLAAVRALARFDVDGELAAIRCPTLVIAGAEDRTIPLDAKQRLAAAIPGARLVVVRDSGHATPIDRPDVFNDVVLRFIGEH